MLGIYIYTHCITWKGHIKARNLVRLQFDIDLVFLSFSRYPLSLSLSLPLTLSISFRCHYPVCKLLLFFSSFLFSAQNKNLASFFCLPFFNHFCLFNLSTFCDDISTFLTFTLLDSAAPYFSTYFSSSIFYVLLHTVCAFVAQPWQPTRSL